MNPKLSILICTINGREQYLERLKTNLEAQALGEPVEILVNKDNREKTVGKKRNELLELATGEYVAFIDDDDNVPEYYVSEILKAIEQRPDVIGFRGYMTENGQRRKEFEITKRYNNWHEANGEYKRTPNHLSPVKRELALRVGFNEDVYGGEDAMYSKALYPMLLSEVFISKSMYHYDFQSKISMQCNRN